MANLSNLAFQASEKLGSLVGNAGQMMEQEIYKNAVEETGTSQYRVAITPYSNLYTVVGLLTDNLSINIDAKWEAAGLLEAITSNPMLSTIYPYMTMALGASGIANPSSVGISTRKIYTSSGYLELEIKFRVVDWQGVGDPIKSAFILSTMCLPTNISDANSQLSPEASASKKVMTTMNGIVKLAATASLDVSDAAGTVAGWVGNATGNNVVTETVKQASTVTSGLMQQWLLNQDLLIAASSPSPVMIEIGQYFRHTDMVVQNVKMDFSRQTTSAGPLYADFTLNVSSRQSILLDNDPSSSEPEIGLLLNGQQARVYR